MQRSRRALLQRRAALEKNVIAGRKNLYKVSLSVVILSWVLLFLLNSLISNGNGSTDGMGAVVGVFSWYEAPPDPDDSIDSRDDGAQSDANSDNNVQESSNSESESVGSSTEVLVNKDDKVCLSAFGKEQVAEVVSESDIKVDNEAPLKGDRLSHIAPPGLDEFKSKVITVKEKPVSSQAGCVIHRVEPGGKEYNYASATKGAKVLDFNKEAKGASNILDKDKDRYLRNPCSAEKFVVVELSEETLVDTIELANFERYSSNLKDFELLSSLIYPSDNWVNLGNFTAENVKHAQRFSLPEPKWARYLKLNLLSHYGSEFYCTLSVVEVYGVDAVERMLEDLISVDNKLLEPEKHYAEQKPLKELTDRDDTHEELTTGIDDESQSESPMTKQESLQNNVPDPLVKTRPPQFDQKKETKPLQVGRMPGDAVLKVLMQKVQFLDINFSVLEKYLEELNSGYGHIFKEFDDDIAEMDQLLEKIKLEIENLQNSKDDFADNIGELLTWKILVSSQVDQLVRNSAMLRLEIERVRDHQFDIESRCLTVTFISLVFGCLAAAKLVIGMLSSVCKIHHSEKFCSTTFCWLILLVSSNIMASILV
ncbi:SUN domain-containing protein 3 isoform X1 [Elaeis guineensis]|uniref:SUN domain-containing protein 4 isoform X1 n=2 Tax=Elaeis guineensis var. tenera TaxID=51953 RepID=A0A6I9SA90_ELAGV|nr:SUN domain-containing protein 4 isoform X1 [Elaeis guineensis]XP_010939757.1 SUN domain-containing protein 4 isoform X1 [Elaeis guineensis]